MDHITTPFGRRTLSLGMVAAQVAARDVEGKAAHKWKTFRAIAEGKDALGVSDRSLSVLNALLSCLPETAMTAGQLVVFPSNKALSLRAHGMAETTLRRHLCELVRAGLVIRRDSPNGKRYAHRGAEGVEKAFGFDLSPVLARAEEFERLAAEAAASRRALARALESRGIRVTPSDAGGRFAAKGQQADEDRLPFVPESFDLIVSAGVLDSVNDLPGALIQCRRALKPDGLFLAGFIGAGSLPFLKRALLAADEAAGKGIAQRVHPMIDVRAAGDLLARAGFVLTVADSEPLDVGYGDPFRLMADLRGMAATNMLAGQTLPLTRGRLASIAQSFAVTAGPDGRLRERFEMVFMTGWAPGPDQPQPARRGSATSSLAAALRSASE